VTVLTQRTPLTLALVLGGLLVGCGGDSEDGTFDREEFPFTFSYPGEFEETEEVSIDQALGANADETAAVGVDSDNILLIQSFTLNIAIDESNLNLAKREIDGLVQQLDPEAASEETEIAGLPALQLDEIAVPSIEDGTSRLTAIFDGDQEYYVNCQSTPEHRDEVEEACDLALETFALK
jgi:hypothetical protein